MNMFLWLLDFVRPSNNFVQSFSILVYNNTIIVSLRLIALRSLSIRQYMIHLREIIVKYCFTACDRIQQTKYCKIAKINALHP